MIVIHIRFACDTDNHVAMIADIMATGKDIESANDKSFFEKKIIPTSYAIIEKVYKGKTLEKNPNLCIDMMNVLVKVAKEFDYRLDRLGQNDKFVDEYQLRFTKETDGRFMGGNKEIRDEI